MVWRERLVCSGLQWVNSLELIIDTASTSTVANSSSSNRRTVGRALKTVLNEPPSFPIPAFFHVRRLWRVQLSLGLDISERAADFFIDHPYF